MESVVDTLAGGLLPGSGGDLVGSGVIAFEDQTPPPIGADDIFNGGTYTDYGVALKTDAADNPGRAGDAPAPAGAQEIAAEDAANVEPDRAPASADHTVAPAPATPAPVVAELTSALDDLGLRGGDSLL